jgi:hypothetical protein
MQKWSCVRGLAFVVAALMLTLGLPHSRPAQAQPATSDPDEPAVFNYESTTGFPLSHDDRKLDWQSAKSQSCRSR